MFIWLTFSLLKGARVYCSSFTQMVQAIGRRDTQAVVRVILGVCLHKSRSRTLSMSSQWWFKGSRFDSGSWPALLGASLTVKIQSLDDFVLWSNRRRGIELSGTNQLIRIDINVWSSYQLWSEYPNAFKPCWPQSRITVRKYLKWYFDIINTPPIFDNFTHFTNPLSYNYWWYYSR